MKSLFLVAATLVFLGTGCASGTEAPELEVRPTVTIVESGIHHATLEGSYCGKTMCVDKIAPQDLVQARDYETITDPHLTVQISESVTALETGLMTDNGEYFKCVIPSQRVNDESYLVDVCAAEPGRYILNLGLTFAESGSGSYLFPFIVEKPLVETPRD